MVTKSFTSSWAACPKAEGVLDELGLSFKTIKVSIDCIDWKATEKNMGRLSRNLNLETVDDYMTSMLDKNVFPMPIVQEISPDSYIVLAGVHRSRAAKDAGFKSIMAYLVPIEHEHEARLISTMTNRREGVRIDKSEAIQQAVYLILNDNLDSRQVCKMFGVVLSTVQHKLIAHSVREKLASLGFIKPMADFILGRLNPVSQIDSVLLLLAKYVYSTTPSQDEITLLLKKIKRAGSEAQKIAIIEVEAAEAKKIVNALSSKKGNSRSIVILPMRTKFLRHFHTLKNLVNEGKTLSGLQIKKDSDEHGQIKKEWAILRTKLDKIINT